MHLPRPLINSQILSASDGVRLEQAIGKHRQQLKGLRKNELSLRGRIGAVLSVGCQNVGNLGNQVFSDRLGS